jgi:hypothetical protein
VVGPFGAGGEAGRGRGLLLRPACEGGADDLLGRLGLLGLQLVEGQRQDLPDDLGAGCGVRHGRTERDLSQRRVLGRGDRALPHLEVDDERGLGGRGQAVAGLLRVPVSVGLVPVGPVHGRPRGVLLLLVVALVRYGDAGGRAVGVAQDAVDVVAAAVDVQGVDVVPAADVLDAEAGGVARAAVLSDQVGGERACLVQLDRGLFVGVGVELDTALLGDDR